MKNTEDLVEFKTPVNVLWEKILLLPIFGFVDSKRGQEIMESMLEKVIGTGSRIIVLDITGVSAVDSAVANQLIKISKATNLVGAETIISGISSEIAQTIVHLGIDLGNITTTGTLAQALELAFDKIGYEVRQR